jgi:hypothetical protein
MVKRYNRLLVAFYVLTDALLAMWAFVLAYGVRFESGLIPVPKGYPPLEQYLHVLPFVAVLTPLAFQIQGVYRLRRGRSRVDDFFAVLIGSILSVVFGVVSTLYVQAYYASDAARSTGAYRCRSSCGRCSWCSVSPSPTGRASSCASCSSGAGAPESASSGCSSPAPAISGGWWPTASCSTASWAIR